MDQDRSYYVLLICGVYTGILMDHAAFLHGFKPVNGQKSIDMQYNELSGLSCNQSPFLHDPLRIFCRSRKGW